MKYEHMLFVTRPLLPGNAIDKKRRAEQTASRLDRLSRSRWQIVGINTIGNSTLAYTLRRPT